MGLALINDTKNIQIEQLLELLPLILKVSNQRVEVPLVRMKRHPRLELGTSTLGVSRATIAPEPLVVVSVIASLYKCLNR